MTEAKIRQPIVTVCGHVDHGKTSILDSLRGSCVQEGEAGGITQKISFTSYPMNQLKASCPLIESSGIKLNIPGFLFIDTPGHAAFTNLRKRGGSLADLAVLVIDINEGIKPQTAEVIQILKRNKTPFLIALNKIDNISGWMPQNSAKEDTPIGAKGIKETIEMQAINIKNAFNEKYMTLIGALNAHGFDADLFYNIKDFTKKIALVPTSARTKEGIPELTMMLCGLSQKYLSNKLELHAEAKGVMLEIKKQKSTHYIETILYDGEIKKGDEILVANFSNPSEPIKTKIRVLEEIQPLCSKFKAVQKAHASTGLRMQLTNMENILPGMPFRILNNNLEEIKKEFEKQVSENVQTQKQGIIAKADSLGSLEALLTLLQENKIQVVKAGIGNISKSDLISAKANLDINELDAMVIGFNVETEEEARLLQSQSASSRSQGKGMLDKKSKVQILTDDVIYKLIENLVKLREEKRREIEKRRLMELTTICKLKILHQYIFRNTSPAIFGVNVEGGKIKQGLTLINESGEKVARIKNIQSDKNSIEEATEGMEVAISLPGVNFERVLGDKKFLYSELRESQFKTFKKNKDLLSESEKKVLQEIAEIKRKTQPEWGI